MATHSAKTLIRGQQDERFNAAVARISSAFPALGPVDYVPVRYADKEMMALQRQEATIAWLERLADVVAPMQSADLGNQSMGELRELAAELGLDPTGIRRKADLVEIIETKLNTSTSPSDKNEDRDDDNGEDTIILHPVGTEEV